MTSSRNFEEVEVRACYPDIQDEEDFCSVPDSGGILSFQSDWPDIEADSCWDPIYEAHPSAVFDFLNCEIEANNRYEDCLADCPEETGR